MIPDIAECFRLMEEYAMLPNIRQHSLVVARVAWRLHEGMRAHADAARVPEQELVVAGALLHDIAKTPCLRNGRDHARAGAEICEGLGYPQLARIVAEHVVLRHHEPERCRQGIFTAGELIYYADKRVLHEEIVSLEKRLEYILERYGAGDPEINRRIRENFAICQGLEQALFRFLPFSPQELAPQMLRHEGAPAGLFTAEGAMGYAGGAGGAEPAGIRESRP